MRRLALPQVDDPQLADNIASNKRLKSSTAIANLLQQIKQQYESYLGSGGNAWELETIAAAAQYSADFSRLYDSPPKCLAFIATLRASLHGACPVCGGGGVGTLDHYLPREVFPELSFFSANLVPACHKCNIEKGVLFRGDAPPARVIHPYFFGDLNGRVVTMRIVPPFEAPLFSIVAVDIEGDDLQVMEWHLSRIVVPAGAIRHFHGMWMALLKDIHLHLGRLSNVESIRAALNDNRDRAASMNWSMNDWDSTFYDGLARDNAAIAFLAGRM